MLTKDFTKIYNELPLWTLGSEIIRTDSWPLFKEVTWENEVQNVDNNIYANVAIVNSNTFLPNDKLFSNLSKLIEAMFNIEQGPSIVLSKAS